MTSLEGSQKGYAYRHLAAKHPLQHLVLRADSGDVEHSDSAGSALHQSEGVHAVWHNPCSCQSQATSEVLELAQMLHTLQQQQVTAESVASATMTHLTLQLKQLEHKHTDQQQQVAALQQAAPGLLARLDDLERDQQQQAEVLQGLQDSQVQQMQQCNNYQQLLQNVQQHCCKLEQQLVTVSEQQQHWQQKQEQLIRQQVAEALQQKQQEVQQHIQQLQEKDCQQQKAASSLQQSVQGIAERLTALQDQLQVVAQQQVHLQQDREDALTAVQAFAASAVKQAQLQDGLGGVERRLLHSMRLEAEAQQHLVELRVTANYERMRSDVAAAQQEIAMQLQQLTQELQDAMARLSSQQSNAADPAQRQCQQQEQQQQPQHYEKQHSAGIDQSVLKKIMAARAARVTAGAQPTDLALNTASSATAEKASSGLCACDQNQIVEPKRSQASMAKQGATCQSWLTESATTLGLSTTSTTSDATAVAQKLLALVKQPAFNLKHTTSAEGGSSRRRSKGSPGKCRALNSAALSGASPSHNVLSDQEVDVVLQLLNALHTAK